MRQRPRVVAKRPLRLGGGELWSKTKLISGSVSPGRRVSREGPVRIGAAGVAEVATPAECTPAVARPVCPVLTGIPTAAGSKTAGAAAAGAAQTGTNSSSGTAMRPLPASGAAGRESAQQ